MPIEPLPGIRLVSPEDIDGGKDPNPALVLVLDWVRDFLGNPNPSLGRAGPVCPFVPRALDLEALWFSLPQLSVPNKESMFEIVRPYREAFLAIPPTEGELVTFKAIILVFPQISHALAGSLIDDVQALLKPAFVDDGLMIGQFHLRSNEPGLHNSSFRPLRSPIPLLAIRWMVATDLPFLTADNIPPDVRIKFLLGYMRAAQNMFIGPRNQRTREWARILEGVLADLAEINDIGIPRVQKSD